MNKNNFTPGQWIEVLDESISGKILKIENQEVEIETIDGFVLTYPITEIIASHDTSLLKEEVHFFSIDKIKEEKEQKLHNHQVVTQKKSRKEIFAVEIDLHIDKLTKNFSKMSSYDMLNLQVDTARFRLEHAISNRIPRLIFIHGEGEGILKTELEYLFSRYSQVLFSPASYKKYGLGATQVCIKQNE